MFRPILALRFLISFLVILIVLLPLYLLTLQTIPNGAEHYYMIDVGETQIVLNTWGTLHATGYPLYVMLGNLLVIALRAIGVNPAAAPSLISLLWGVLSLAVVYRLARHLLSGKDAGLSSQFPVPSSQSTTSTLSDSHASSHTPQYSWINQIKRDSSGRTAVRPYDNHSGGFFSVYLSVLVTILLGLTRTAWIHNVIAEIYSFGLLLLVGLVALALWQSPIRGRIYWLALLGGIGVFHHRALLMAAPALVYAVWPELKAAVSGQQSAISQEKGLRAQDSGRRKSRLSLITHYSSLITRLFLLGLVGFLPYIYLPLRAASGAAWVYGEPGTWAGFWDQFLGREAARFIGPPGSLDGILANIALVNNVLITDLTVPGLLAGLAGLLLALSGSHRRAATTFLLLGGVAYAFHVLLYTDILSALILPITLSAAFGWLFLAEAVSNQLSAVSRQRILLIPHASYLIPFLFFAVVLIAQNRPFIRGLTTDSTGLETIHLVYESPPGAAVMLDWGPRHFAVGFARDVLGLRRDLLLLDHKADFRAVVAADRRLVTPDYTFYNRPVNWWAELLGMPVYLRAAAPHLVEIATEPLAWSGELRATLLPFTVQRYCHPDRVDVEITWGGGPTPERDLSVFVHLLDSAGNVLAQDDRFAPVYGLRPLTSWTAGELILDYYSLPRLPDGRSIRYGLYNQRENGEFVNEVEDEIPVRCDE